MRSIPTPVATGHSVYLHSFSHAISTPGRRPAGAGPAPVLLRRLVAGLLLALAVPALAQGGARPPVSLEIGQRDWLAADGSVQIPCSAVGWVEVAPTRKAAPMLLQTQGAFVNVVTRVADGMPQWSVRNLRLRYPSLQHLLDAAPTVDFDLGVAHGTCLSRIEYSVSVTQMPLNGPDMTQELSRTRVLHEGYLVGGRIGGGSALSSFPDVVGPWNGANIFTPLPSAEAAIGIPLGDVAKVDEDVDGCAPASCARSIDYLTDGEAGDPQDVYEDLVDDMDTSLPGGTDDADMLAGKNAFAAANGLDIDSSLEYVGADEVVDDLEAGADIEILISWTGGGGHAAMVTGIQCFPDGRCQITYVDDPKQGDGRAANQEHVIMVEADGSFPGGQVDGFLVEHAN